MNHNLPPAISTFASDWDSAYAFLVWASLISGIIMLGGMIYFILKYNRRSETDKTAYISHNQVLEFLWKPVVDDIRILPTAIADNSTVISSAAIVMQEFLMNPITIRETLM